MTKHPFDHFSYEVRIPGSFLLYVPDFIDDTTLLIATLHGYGSNPEAMLRLTSTAAGRQHIVAALQAPNQHYIAQPTADAPAGYNWGIRQHWRDAIGTHHQMVEQVLLLLRERFGIGPERTILCGFSQPVGLNYRFVTSRTGLVRGVIGICGGLPRDWEENNQPTDAAILHISRDNDEFYPVSVVKDFPGRLNRRAPDVEFHLIPGGHRFPSSAHALIQPWLNRIISQRP